jgi:hypothetical protein
MNLESGKENGNFLCDINFLPALEAKSCLSVCLSVCLFACLSACLSVVGLALVLPK